MYHGLIVNREKTKCMFFNYKSAFTRQNINLYHDDMEVTRCYKYLGPHVLYNLKDFNDIEFRLNHFYASFNRLFRDSKLVNINKLLSLFNSSCVPNYSLQLWNANIFKCCDIAYNKLLKRTYDVPAYASVRITANNCNQLFLNIYSTDPSKTHKKNSESTKSSDI